MSTPESFEDRLKALRFAPLPPAWRREILDVAAAQIPSPRHGFWCVLWQEWITPYRTAYLAVAAAWMLILILQYATPVDLASGQLASAARSSPPEAPAFAQWNWYQQQQKEMARLF